MVPYFFELKKVDGKFKYVTANRVAFCQVRRPEATNILKEKKRIWL